MELGAVMRLSTDGVTEFGIAVLGSEKIVAYLYASVLGFFFKDSIPLDTSQTYFLTMSRLEETLTIYLP